MQQSVLARGFKKGTELYAEEGPDSPNPTAKPGEGLGPTFFTAHGLYNSSSTPGPNSPPSVWKEPSLRSGLKRSSDLSLPERMQLSICCPC